MPSLKFAASLCCIMIFAACSTEPQEINYGKDSCDFCKMTIMDEKFATQCISTKGKVYQFDDIHCVLAFLKNGGVWRNELSGVYFSDYSEKNKWIKEDAVFLLESENLRSPMGSNMIAFSSEQKRDEAFKKFQGRKLLWKDINPFLKR
jgi:copper chaperone NosL